ncbi:hypothetical protein EUGRSUZ_H04051 [Eucalyptus grandis]|uniref:Myb/SANT-like domain-containing protein n=2 Tax=Eucalyptus grandis TaxID=71139 RepID=A0A059B5I0_EUCGR|nr:hypothetical protein EUGRSUZ_H04051 [Eucalyptus grandis]
MASQKEMFNAKWTEPLTNLFVSLLVEEVQKGNRTTSTFNKAGWNNIRAEFTKQSGYQYNLLQLKNKVNKLRRQYSSFKKLISQSGFGWDNVNNKVVVDDPSIWESHITTNNGWAKFKKNGFPQYPQLCIVFGDTYATGDHAIGNIQDLTVSNEGDGGGNAISDLEDLSEHPIDDDVFTSDHTSTPIHNQHRLDRTPNVKRRRNSSSFSMADTCKAIQDMLKARSSQSESGSIGSQVTPPPVTPPPVDPFSIAVVIDILVNMNDLDQDLYNKAVERACNSAI